MWAEDVPVLAPHLPDSCTRIQLCSLLKPIPHTLTLGSFPLRLQYDNSCPVTVGVVPYSPNGGSGETQSSPQLLCVHITHLIC